MIQALRFGLGAAKSIWDVAREVAPSPIVDTVETLAPPLAPKPIALPPAPGAPLDDLDVPSAFPIGDLSAIDTRVPGGQVFRVGGGFVEGMRVQVRRIEHANGKPGFDIQLRVAEHARAAIEERLVKRGAKRGALTFPLARRKTRPDGQVVIARDARGAAQSVQEDHPKYAPPDMGPRGNEVLHLEGRRWKIDAGRSDGYAALRGFVRIELEGDDAAATRALTDVVNKLGLQSAFVPATKDSLRRNALSMLLARIDPGAVEGGATAGELEQALRARGVSDARMNGLRYEEVAPGHFTVVDAHALAEAKKAGLAYGFSTVEKAGDVADILVNGTQRPTMSRWSEGLLIEGLSSRADIATGGAVGVFARLVTPNAEGEAWVGRAYKLIVPPEVMARLDVWGWPGDHFGQSWGLDEDNFGARLVRAVDTAEDGGYAPMNEIVMPHGNGLIAGVVATTPGDRKRLLHYLADEGFTPPDGRSLDDFVRLEPTIRTDLGFT